MQCVAYLKPACMNRFGGWCLRGTVDNKLESSACAFNACVSFQKCVHYSLSSRLSKCVAYAVDVNIVVTLTASLLHSRISGLHRARATLAYYEL